MGTQFTQLEYQKGMGCRRNDINIEFRNTEMHFFHKNEIPSKCH